MVIRPLLRHELMTPRCLLRRTSSSRLNGKFADVARSSAPPAAEKTDEIEGRFHSQSHRHRQRKGGQKNSTQQRNGASFPTEDKEKPEESLSTRGDNR